MDPQTELCLIIISRLSSALAIHMMRKEALLTPAAQFLSRQLLNISLSTAMEDDGRYFCFVSSSNHSSLVPWFFPKNVMIGAIDG